MSRSDYCLTSTICEDGPSCSDRLKCPGTEHVGWRHATSWDEATKVLADNGHLHDVDGDAVYQIVRNLPNGEDGVGCWYDSPGSLTTTSYTVEEEDFVYMLVPERPPGPLSEDELAEVLTALGVTLPDLQGGR